MSQETSLAVSQDSEMQLPSIECSAKLLQGDMSQIAPLIGYSALRAAQIAAGLYLSGNWDDRGWSNAIGASLMGQAFVTTYSALNNSNVEERLPSSKSAMAFVRGTPGATTTLIQHLLGRSLIFASGMYLAGEREDVLKKGLSAGVTIEVIVLYLAYLHLQKELEAK